MDNLTHGLFGLAIGALRRPDAGPGSPQLTPTDKAVLVTCVLAAELPDLDSFWPAADPVLGVLQAHRGPTHALLAAPLVALIAAAVSRLFFRGARWGPLLGFGTLATVFAHLLADAWTGWGTRLLLPFSDTRLSFDWTLVVDPLVTLPLMAGAIWALRRRAQFRRWVLAGAALASIYVVARVAVRAHLLDRVTHAYPDATRVEVFPAWFQLFQWRYVVEGASGYHAGEVRVGAAPAEQAHFPREDEDLSSSLRANPTVREALAWARLPLIEWEGPRDGARTLRIADLRYHLNGRPTLAFEFTVSEADQVSDARLVRGGSARELFQRWWGRRDPQ